ncbi:MAG: PepSY domain-containing protein [Lachnospiraceae bacterium]|nr:PepSY domain-containing protein [Lachnospiraceae bacterium]
MRMQRSKDGHKLNTWILGGMAACATVLMVCMGSTMASAKAIGSLEQAKKLARQKVKSATITEAEQDTDDGVAVYEVSLHKGHKEYDLKYRKSDGKLLEYEWEQKGVRYGDQTKKNISKAKIKKKALKKVKKASVRSIRLYRELTRTEYKVRLQKGNYRYTLVYDAKNAKLLEYEQKYGKSGTGASTSKDIGKKEAKKIALKMLPGATVAEIERYKDGGDVYYKVELVKGKEEYEIIMDAEGRVRKGIS